jgi:hypothetical protein
LKKEDTLKCIIRNNNSTKKSSIGFCNTTSGLPLFLRKGIHPLPLPYLHLPTLKKPKSLTYFIMPYLHLLLCIGCTMATMYGRWPGTFTIIIFHFWVICYLFINKPSWMYQFNVTPIQSNTLEVTVW